MKRLLFFIKKTYVFVLFVVLEVIAVTRYANSTSYTRAHMIATTSVVTGGVQRELAKIDGYFGLRRENDALNERIAQLSTEVDALRAAADETRLVGELEAKGSDTTAVAGDSTGFRPVGVAMDHVFTTAAVIGNTITRPGNFITLDKGRLDGVEPEMAVVTPEGSIVGWVMDVRKNTSVAISLLNSEFRTGGRIRGRDYFGSVLWKGQDPEHVTLTEIQKYAEFAPGDTVVTDYSSRFPKDLIIGTVESAEMTELGYYDIKVKVATRFSALGRVLLVRYFDIEERLELENYKPEEE